MQQSIVFRRPAPIVGLVLLGIFGFLYRIDRESYFTILQWIGIVPFRYPFLDGQYILSSVECWKQGVDIYIDNPCDVLNRTFDYSPLWLRATFLPTDKIWTNPLGLGLATTFFGFLFFFPQSKRPFEAVVAVLATISTMTVFAVERANVDLAMFILSTLAALWLTRGRHARWLGYSAILGAGLLKFYPIVLFIFTLSERPRNFLRINIIIGFVLISITWFFLPEIAKSVANIPRPSYFGDAFGAINLPFGLVQAFFTSTGFDAENGHWVLYFSIALLVVLAVDTVWRAHKFLHREGFSVSLEGLPNWDRALLVAGAALVCGCFFAGPSIGYRGILLLLILPGLLALTRRDVTPWVKRLCLTAVMMVVFLMWGEGIRQFLSTAADRLGVPERFGSPVAIAFWFLRELVWWRVISLLGAILFWFVATSETGRIALQIIAPAERRLRPHLLGR